MNKKQSDDNDEGSEECDDEAYETQEQEVSDHKKPDQIDEYLNNDEKGADQIKMTVTVKSEGVNDINSMDTTKDSQNGGKSRGSSRCNGCKCKECKDMKNTVHFMKENLEV